MEDNKRLKLSEIVVYGTHMRDLFVSRADPNVILGDLCNCLHNQPHNTNERISMVDGTEAGVLEEVTKVAI